MVRIKYYSSCPYCGGTSIRVCYGYDSTERCVVYHCKECDGTFTITYKGKRKGSGYRK